MSTILLQCGCRLGFHQRLCEEAEELLLESRKLYSRYVQAPRSEKRVRKISWEQARKALADHHKGPRKSPPSDGDPMEGGGAEAPGSYVEPQPTATL